MNNKFLIYSSLTIFLIIAGLIIFNYGNLTGNVISSSDANSLKKGLVSDWEGGDLNGSFITDSYGTNHGLNEGVSLNGSGFNKSYVFNSLDEEYIKIPDDRHLTPSEGFTYELWIKFGNITSTSVILNKDRSNSYDIQYVLKVTSSGTLQSFVRLGGQDVGYTSNSGVVESNGFYHIVFTWDGYPQYNHTNLYVGNTSVINVPYSTQSYVNNELNYSGGNLYVGGTSYNSAYSNMSLYSMRFWNRSLNSTEVNLLWNSGTKLTESDLGITPKGFSHKNYYVSSSEGNDSSFGLDINYPIKSLDKINNLTFLPGDSILFKRGDSWVGTLTPATSGILNNPIAFGAYGTGDKPKIYGSAEITGWTLYSGNIYKATVSLGNVTQLFLDNERMLAARWPNTGYQYPSTIISNNSFSDSDLNDSINYAGAIAIIRTSAYTLGWANVTSSSSQNLTLDTSFTGSSSLSTNKGYMLVNKLEFLDQPGEWYFDSNTNTVYFWTPNGDSPSGYSVRGSVYDNGIKIKQKYLNFNNLEILQNSRYGIWGISSNGIIENMNIENTGDSGIYLGYGSNQDSYSIKNNNVNNTAGSGMTLHTHYSNISNNSISNVGLFYSWGIRKIPIVNGLEAGEDHNNVIEYNRLNNIAYCGISFRGENNLVRYNYINGATKYLDDGGGIYTYNSGSSSAGSVISNNILIDISGAPEGDLGRFRNNGEGGAIYLDAGTSNVTVENNIIIDSMAGFVIGSDNNNNFVQNNLVYDAALGVVSGSSNYAHSYLLNNTIYQTNNLKNYVWWENSSERIIKLDDQMNLTADYNKYFAHYYSYPLFGSNNYNPPIYYYATFEDWQSLSGRDLHSTFDNSTLPVGWSEKIIYNDNFSKSKIILLHGNTYQDVDGNNLTEDFILTPFTSTIILGSNLDAITTSLNSCGDSVKADSEECDSGSNNGVVPTPSCGVTISYFSSLCKSVSVTGSSCDSSGSGGSSSVSSASTSASSSDTSKDKSGTTYNVNTEELKKGFTKTFGVEDVVQVSDNDTNVTFKLISSEGVELNIGSNISESFVIGDVKEFDTDNDGYYDLKVSFNSLEGDKASVTITKIDGEKVNVSPENNLENSTSAKDSQNKSNPGKFAYLIILLTILILIIVLVVIYVRHRNSLSNYRFSE